MKIRTKLYKSFHFLRYDLGIEDVVVVDEFGVISFLALYLHD